MEKVLMSYMYRQQWREKPVTLEEVARWTREGKYEGRVNAVRGLQLTLTDYGMGEGPEAAVRLPKVKPAKGPKGAYTGLVLLSFPVQAGVEALEKLRRQEHHLRAAAALCRLLCHHQLAGAAEGREW